MALSERLKFDKTPFTMKFHRTSLCALLFFLVFAWPADAWAQSINDYQGSITEATVYQNGAMLVQTAEVKLQAGMNEVRIVGLPFNIDQNSLYIAGSDCFEITGMRQELNYAGGTPVHPLVRAKMDSLEDTRFTIKTRQALKNAYSEELLMLQANRNVGGKNNIVLAEDLEEIADFFRERVKQINYLVLELNEEENELKNLASRLEKELNDLRALNRNQSREVFVQLQAKARSSCTLTLNYFVREAGWYTYYDIRSKGSQEDVEITMKARVNQSTGVDWEKVKLTLSTGNPSLGGTVPELGRWYIDVYDPVAVNSRGRNDYAAPQAAKGMAPSADEEVMVMESMSVTQTRQTLNTSYAVSMPYDISGDNKAREVEIQRISLPADYRHYAVPKASKDSYLVAEVRGWEAHSLMPGEASVFFEGGYVGKSFVNPGATTDTLNLSLGRDRNVKIDYEQIKDFNQTAFIGGKKQSTRAYKIRVYNAGPKPINLRVEDQIPLSRSGEAEVTVEELSGGKLDPESGKVSWDLQLDQGASVEYIVRFSVKYPKKKVLGGL